MNACTSTATIKKLRQSFAVHGLPETVVTDNGTCFTSDEFSVFMRHNGIKHIKSAPYHPSTNGLAERAVQTLKQGLKKLKQGSLETRVSRFLSSYRTTPQSITGLSPSEMLFNRKVRTRFDLVQPCVERQMVQKQLQQKLHHDRAPKREYGVGDSVCVKEFAAGAKWLPAVVSKVTGPLSYMVNLPDGRPHKRHVDHVITRRSNAGLTEQQNQSELINPPLTTVPETLPPGEFHHYHHIQSLRLKSHSMQTSHCRTK